MKKVRIVSDGTSYGTTITDVESGEEIQLVQSLKIEIDAQTAEVYAHLVVLAPQVDVTLDATIENVCPCCRRPFIGGSFSVSIDSTDPDIGNAFITHKST